MPRNRRGLNELYYGPNCSKRSPQEAQRYPVSRAGMISSTPIIDKAVAEKEVRAGRIAVIGTGRNSILIELSCPRPAMTEWRYEIAPFNINVAGRP